MSPVVVENAIDRMQCRSPHCWSFQVSEAERHSSRQYINENSIAKCGVQKVIHVFIDLKHSKKLQWPRGRFLGLVIFYKRKLKVEIWGNRAPSV